MATFPASHPPDFGAAVSIKPNTRVTAFGDGYEQRQAQGLNHQPKVWNLTFSVRTDAEANVIEGFLAARDAVEAFDWTDLDGVPGKYVCRAWQRSKAWHNRNTITCQFEQVFEP